VRGEQVQRVMAGADHLDGRYDRPGVTDLVAAHDRTSVAAPVEKDVDLPVLMSADDHRLAADRRRAVVADGRNLRLVTDVHPRTLENPAHLRVEDTRVHVGVGVDLERVGPVIDEIGERHLGGCNHGASPECNPLESQQGGILV
jgi:hypothetical protein